MAKRKKKSKFHYLRYTLLAFVLAIVIFYFFQKEQSAGEANYSQIAEFSVEADTSKKDILEKLYNQGFIKSKSLTDLLIFFSPIFKDVKNGVYNLSKNMNPLEIYRELKNPSLIWITIPEGLRKEEVAKIAATELNWDSAEKEKFLNLKLPKSEKSMEGYYFPSKYLVAPNLKSFDFGKIMMSKFKEEVQESEFINNAIDIETAVIIASMLEREASGKSDMDLISGIIWNRLFANMNLEIDATLQYAKGNEKDGWWRKVSSRDKNIDSPYNTYTNLGLPPSAISNPGLNAIRAAFNPTVTACFYYLHDNNGKIYCSRTYQEHISKVNIYLR